MECLCDSFKPFITHAVHRLRHFSRELRYSIEKLLQNKRVAQLKEAKQQAQAAQLAKTAFLRNMEHDFRTPFSGIYSLANLLYQQEDDPRKKEFLGHIAQSAGVLLEQHNAILDLARADAGLVPSYQKPFNLHRLLEKLMAVEMPAAKEKLLTFSVHCAPEVPAELVGDEARLFYILINVVGNAIKFTPQGYIKVAVTLVTEKQSGEIVLCFQVEDSGIGMLPAQQHLIFDAFYRLTPSNQGFYKGLGVGLHVVKRLVEEMRGSVTVSSALNAGTTFTCTLTFKKVIAN